MNEIIKWLNSHRMVGSKNIKKWQNHVILSVATLKPIDERVSIHCEWRERNRARDPDNVAAFKKIVMDGLVKAGKLKDDRWLQVAFFTDTFTIDNENPGVLMEFRSTKV